jgi:HIRAN domain-containing protein
VAEPRAIVEVNFEERYWYPEDGGQVWLAGYVPIDPVSGRWLANRAPELTDRGIHVVRVAGAAQHHAEGLASDDVEPGKPLVLRRDPGNEHDPNAIAVDTRGGAQVGWVPRELAAEVAPELDRGEVWSAIALREQRPSPRDPRSGVTMLMARAAEIELRVRP